MLKNIDPLLNADILHTLASMGHGDSITLCDSNFPASSVASGLIVPEPLQMAVDLNAALKAVLSVMPIDTFDLEISPVRAMQVVDKPDEMPAVIADCKAELAQHDADVGFVERHQFYDAARQTFAVIRTSETRPYGNLIIRKGVVF